MFIQSVLASSLEKIFPEQSPVACHTPFTMLKNDTFAFQVALRPVSIPSTRIAKTQPSSTLDQNDSICADASIPVQMLMYGKEAQ